MDYFSTRGDGPVTLDDALRMGIADDGGLFLPEQMPIFEIADFANTESIPQVAEVLLRPFFEGSALEEQLEDILAETFSFPMPLTALPAGDRDLALLELYHGQTAAFKDVGAGFLAACLSRDSRATPAAPLTILVATSGDTGGAVAAAFDKRPGMRVVVSVSRKAVCPSKPGTSAHLLERQCGVADSTQGSFDDCQALVKAAQWRTAHGCRRRYRFSSANSINIGRLLPQSTYYADASLRHYRRTWFNKPGFVIPTGNLGNAFACIMATRDGLADRTGHVLATNANRTIPDYFETLAVAATRQSCRRWRPRWTWATPVTWNGLRKLVLGEADVLREPSRRLVCRAMRKSKRRSFGATSREFGFATCPHTATATHAWRQMRRSATGRAHMTGSWWRTAHPGEVRDDRRAAHRRDRTVAARSSPRYSPARAACDCTIAPELAALATAQSDDT